MTEPPANLILANARLVRADKGLHGGLWLRNRLIAAGDLADAGLIDVISSDYVPAAPLNAALLLSDRRGDMARAVARVATAPAAAGVTDRGRIWPGLRGDVIRVARVGGAARVRGVWLAGNRVA